MPPHIVNRPPIPYLRNLVGARPGHSISELYEPQASRAVLHAGLYVVRGPGKLLVPRDSTTRVMANCCTPKPSADWPIIAS
jgi:hypothetical protein